jgi:chromosomal replication initiation ATPase DnaA
MFAASYRNTERGIAKRAPVNLAGSRMDLAVIDAAERKAMSIIAEAETRANSEAASIVSKAQIKADSLISEAVEKAGQILGLAGMEPGEHKQPVIDIIRLVATRHGVSVADIKAATHVLHIVAARHEAMAMVYTLRPDLSLPAIGRIFARDHTTVLSAVRKLGVYRGDPALYRRTQQESGA